VTGQYPSTHRATHNHAPLDPQHSPLLPERLRRRGYFTHIVGKSHLTPCHDPCSLESAPHIHNREHFRRWHGPWYGFERADIAIGHTTEAHACGMHYGVWLEDRGVDTRRYFGHTAYEAYGAWDLPEEHHNSRWTADVTIESVRRCAEAGRPFFLWANFQDPHNPCMAPEPWASLHRDAPIPAFGFKPGEPECFAHKPPFYREILAQPGPYRAHPSDPGLPGAGNVCHLDWSADQTRANAVCYAGMVSLLDHHVGRILDALREFGVADRTLVVFASDHGDLLGDHGFWYKSLVAYDESMRVPLLVRLPGRIPAGARSDAIQNLVDLAPTFLDYAASDCPEMEGVSQRAAWEEPGRRVRTDTVVEERPYATDFNQRVLIGEGHRLAFYAGRDYGELYDVDRDPHQIRNLWSEPASRDVKARMTARILSHEANKARPRLSPSDQNRLWAKA
jgi:uncharacterized sulfatase